MPLSSSPNFTVLASAARAAALGGLAVVVGVGCPTTPEPDNPFATSSASNATTPTGDGSTGSTSMPTTMGADSTAGSTAASDDDGVKLDVGPDDLGQGEQDYCNFVDILFVIDNSLSMNEYQLALALAWPTFVDAMWDNLPVGTDLHVGMTTTSFYNGSCSEFIVNCATTASAQTVLDHYVPPDMGNTGVNGEQGRLFEWDGQRYFSAVVGEDSTDFKNWFSQAAVAAGETGCSFEMMSAAAGYAFHPANAAYNDGFLRDEGAVLVIVVLTDEPDKSPEGAMAYYDMVVQAKAGCGGDQCVLVTGLVDQCIEGANNALWQFFNLFPSFTTTGSIDQPGDYAQVVGSALAQVIGETCDQIPPAG
ncbi:MAG: hypothetical protein KDK70_15545 [Myxococcales bacterium]|nr:hypothetical protein [Myxococcales bacterium]